MFSNWRKKEGAPLYIQLAGHLKSMIISGEIKAGQRLASIRTIATDAAVSKNTVLSALAVLAAEGFIQLEDKKRPVVMWKNSIPLAPDWFQYLSKSKHVPTENIYRNVSAKRSNSSVINLHEVRLGQDFAPGTLIQKIIANLSVRIKDIHHQSYFDLKGIPWVREAVCNHLRRYNIYVDSKQVLMAQGPLNAMSMITQGLLAFGMNVFLPVPNTLEHLKNFTSSGFNIEHIKQDEQGILPYALETKIKNGKGILHVNAVSYWPNSVTMSETRIKQVLEICVRNRTPIMESDMMREYGAEEPPAYPMKAYDTSGNVIYICSFTRPLLPGLRVSAIVAPEIVIDHLSDMRLQADWGMDTISQLIMGEMINSGLFYEYIATLRPLLAERLEETNALMHKYLDGLAVWQKNKNGLSFWVEFDKRIDISKLDTFRDNVLISPGKLYGDSFKNCLWICYSGVTLKEFEYSLTVLSNAAFKELKHF